MQPTLHVPNSDTNCAGASRFAFVSGEGILIMKRRQGGGWIAEAVISISSHAAQQKLTVELHSMEKEGFENNEE